MGRFFFLSWRGKTIKKFLLVKKIPGGKGVLSPLYN
ncbi:hypothetical protein CDSM653_02078 [Caldanaerobacter subterraneus subsp. pacificus DSM 12653]|uniref:Uncharacterized protein n=1 Tax=Caldanaerobacter subterraneus subsp. pacificus DSM 12653 TaxID=391606 RepID=A0A0F5PJU5_9THEO|nr:hypothetical protein CDSM653_02078 [Caldanaerobacter subterraneus subsp. pacificus DSM 12653]